jgi:membrane protease YdiL (CAAX protease family)
VLRLALLFEGGLILLAVALGWWLNVPPFERLQLEWRALAWGCLATGPPLLFLLWARRTRWGPIAQLVQVVERKIAPLFAGSTPGELLIVALLAGIGEEAFFRGVLQPWLDTRFSAPVALTITSALFGAAHWLTSTYALLATLVGLYLGWLVLVSGNLLVPIVTHALYDLVALCILVRVKQDGSGDVV